MSQPHQLTTHKIYSRPYTDSPKQAPDNTTVPGWHYVGCYGNSNIATPVVGLLNGVVNSVLDLNNGITWAGCAAYCADYKFCAIENGISCSCGNNVSFSPVRFEDKECKATCLNVLGALSLCGGPKLVSVLERDPPVEGGGVAPAPRTGASSSRSSSVPVVASSSRPAVPVKASSSVRPSVVPAQPGVVRPSSSSIAPLASPIAKVRLVLSYSA